jgi:hypothetical protein
MTEAEQPSIMSRKERDDLAKVVRLRAKVTKASLDTLAKDRCADVEAQLSAIHKADAVQWRAITAEADRVVKDANVAIAHICDAEGIRPEFRPGLALSWHGRGANACADRRAELRKLAYARVEADRRAGHQLVDHWAAEQLTTLIAGALTSADAHAFLAALPAAETLLPPIRLTPELDVGRVVSPRAAIENE